MKNLKVLWVSPTLPFPVNAGNRRHVEYLTNTISQHVKSIDFILYGWEKEAIEHRPVLETMFSKFENFPQPTDRKMSKAGFWGIDDWVSNEFMEFVKNFSAKRQYDVVIVEYVWMSRLLTIFNGNVVKIIDTHDIFTDRDLLLENQGIEKQWFYTRQEEERLGLQRANLILAITYDDSVFFRRILHGDAADLRTIIHCRTGIQSEVAECKSKSTDGKVVLGYLGSSNALNKLSLDLFLSELSKHLPDNINVQINVGGSISHHVLEYPNIKIVRKGYVAEASDFYREVDVIVAPMVEGTGLKIKCVEAIAFAKPFVATRYASNDLPVRSIWHTFSSIDLMASYLGRRLSKDLKLGKTASTVQYLQMESDRLLDKISHEQTEAEHILIENIKKLAACSHRGISETGNSPGDKIAVSVIIAAYNTEQYLARCLDSLLCDRLKNIEIILVDDGSSDSTGAIADAYAARDKRVSVIHQVNSGQGVARNRGLDISTGEFVYFVDSDDYVGKDSLYFMYEMSVTNKLDICSPERPYLSARPIEFISALTGWCCFVRRSLLETGIRIRQPAIRSGQDGVFANMVLTRCKRAAVCKYAKYFYEKRDDSTFNSLKRELSVIPDLVEEHISTLREFYDAEGLLETESVSRYILFLQDETYKWRFLAHLDQYQPRDAERIYLAIKAELCVYIDNVSDEAKKYLDERFLKIADLSFHEFYASYEK